MERERAPERLAGRAARHIVARGLVEVGAGGKAALDARSEPPPAVIFSFA